MDDCEPGVRLHREIAPDDPDFSVRLASIDDLLRLMTGAKRLGLTATWSSVEALSGQVRSDTMAIICPLFRNGAPTTGEPVSFRCHIWFVRKSDGAQSVSLVDVTEEMFSGLSEADSPARLKKVVRALIDGAPLVALD